MFNVFKPKKIVFSSNPPLSEKVIVVPEKNDVGSPINKCLVVPGDNRSKLDGVHFIYEEMSLRAKLNLGIPMSRVPNVGILNDPTDIQNIQDGFVEQASSRYQQLLKSENEPPKIE